MSDKNIELRNIHEAAIKAIEDAKANQNRIWYRWQTGTGVTTTMNNSNVITNIKIKLVLRQMPYRKY